MRLPLQQFASLSTRRVCYQSTCRGFATSSTAKFEILGPIAITAQLISSIHDVTGLSYGLSIPFTALALRSIVTLPLAIHSQKKMARRIELRPLIFQWTYLLGSIVARKHTPKNVKDSKKASDQVNQETYQMVSSPHIPS